MQNQYSFSLFSGKLTDKEQLATFIQSKITSSLPSSQTDNEKELRACLQKVLDDKAAQKYLDANFDNNRKLTSDELEILKNAMTSAVKNNWDVMLSNILSTMGKHYSILDAQKHLKKLFFLGAENGSSKALDIMIKSFDKADFQEIAKQKDKNGMTLLHYAVKSRSLETINALTGLYLSLLDKSSAANAENNGGNTPLHFAAESGDIQMMNALSKFYYQPEDFLSAQNKTNQYGKTPLDLLNAHNKDCMPKAKFK